MADATNPPEAEQTDTPEAPEVQEDLLAGAEKPDAVRNAIQREREAAKRAKLERDELAQRVREFEERDKSEQERLEDRAKRAEQRIPEVEGENLRLRVALAKSLPPELIDRLRGGTQEEIEADADELLRLVNPPARASDYDGGARRPATTTVSDDPKTALGQGLLAHIEQNR